MLQHVGKLILIIVFFYLWKKVLIRQNDTHAKKEKPLSPEMHITSATETTDSDAVVVPRQIIWSRKLLLRKIWKNHSGRKSVLALAERVLLRNVFANREQGIQVTMMIFRKYVKKNCPHFLQKYKEANCQAIQHFLHQVGLTH